MSFAVERTLSIKEFAGYLGYSYHTTRRLVINRAGVLVIGKLHKTRRIPESLALHIREELRQGGRV